VTCGRAHCLAESARGVGYKGLAYGLSLHYRKMFDRVGLTDWIR